MSVIKWKLSVLSLEKKHMILSHLEKGEKAVILASEFQITKQQVLENIKHFANNFETSNSLQRKLLKSAKNKEWDSVVHSRTFKGYTSLWSFAAREGLEHIYDHPICRKCDVLKQKNIYFFKCTEQ